MVRQERQALAVFQCSPVRIDSYQYCFASIESPGDFVSIKAPGDPSVIAQELKNRRSIYADV